MERILKTILYFLLIGLVLFAGYGVYRVWRIFDPKDPAPRIAVSDLRWNNLPPIVLPANLATNPAASNAAWEANHFLTNEPWVAVSNDRIYTGLHSREWSMEYKVEQMKHEAGIILGPDLYGAYYRYNPVGRLTIGGQVVWDGDQLKVGAMTGWRW